MHFRYYVTDLNDGLIAGTNDPGVATDFAASEDCFVVDTLTGLWLQPGGAVVIYDISVRSKGDSHE